MTDQPPVSPAPSYRALLAVPNLSRVLLAMMIARLAQTILGFAIVLFALTEYGDAGVAGLATFASIFPGLLASPIAGALLDRHGRIRLVILDYLVTVVAVGLIGGLALAGRLPPALLIVIVSVSSLTGILSVTGVRSLFPLIVPKPLWERVNAVDSTGYVAASILAPPIAAGLVAILGGPMAMIVIAAAFLVAAVSMIGILDPPSDTASTGSILVDAWQGLQYTWRNPTLRGLGFSISLLNIAGGMTTIVIPIIVLQRLALDPPVVGLLFAASGVAGMISVFLFGRVDSRGREWNMLIIPMLGVAPATALLLGALDAPTAVALALIGTSQGIFGLLNGPLDVALFTIRQRRTDPAWMGRAFAVSMAFNFAGYPIGAAITGAIAGYSISAAIVLGVAACVVAAVAAARIIPRHQAGPSAAGA